MSSMNADAGAAKADALLRRSEDPKARSKRRRGRVVLSVLSAAILACLAAAWSVQSTASQIQSELNAAMQLVPDLKEDVIGNRPEQALTRVAEMRTHTGVAKESAENPVWTLASSIPYVGQNFSAVSEVARSADDVATLGLSPLVRVFSSMKWDSLLPSSSGTDLRPLVSAKPDISSAARTVRLSAERLDRIDTKDLLPQVAEPLMQAQKELSDASKTLGVASDAVGLAPKLMGDEAPRSYLLMIQNNAEARASGGIPGALAVLTLDHGKLSLGAQSSAGDIGIMTPTLAVDPQQQQIYSSRLGKYMQDVNLTPDFPTAAATAQAMWEKKTGQRVDGVISIDPVVLSYILQATGPVEVNGPELAAIKLAGLPSELTGSNVVQTLLSDVYAKIPQPKLQDLYFAGVAKEVFSALSNGKGEAKGLIAGLTKGTEEGRVLVWSANPDEQSVLGRYAISGSVSGASVSPAEFGVYLNDGTGAKMDYYVKRTVQLVRECPVGGYEQTIVRVTSTNTAPADAATTLPPYVTGDGAFGVPPGTVQTNVVAYGPVQANIESAAIQGQKIPFAPYLHANRPVGVVSQRLAPGESKTLEFTFGKIVQHAEPNVVVTPTVQSVKDVVLATENASCDPEQ